MAERKLAMYGFDPGTGRNMGPRDGGKGSLLPHSRWPSFFSKVVARLQWDANAIDLSEDARAWRELPDERRRRLTTIVSGFCVGEGAVSEQIAPFADFLTDSLQAWVFFLQERDEARHAVFFDRIAAEVLGAPGDTPEERRAAVRADAPPGLLELFEERLPALSAELAAGRVKLEEGVALYHMLLEGIVLYAGQLALLEDLADGALPGMREGLERVQLDERWHIGFGLRCLVQLQPSQEVIDDVLAQAQKAAAAWGDVVPAEIRERVAPLCARRLHVAKLLDARVAAV
jgi:ribonucleoside-diphosphate reductase beta chain